MEGFIINTRELRDNALIKQCLITISGLGFICLPSLQAQKKPKDPLAICSASGNDYQNPSRSEVYKDVPFKSGEESKYTLLYSSAKVHVGYGIIRVLPPLKFPITVEGKDKKEKSVRVNHRVFQAEAYTGDWYKLIFAGHDKIQAVSRPWNFAISKFYIQQNEKKPFSPPTQKEKWLNFNHGSCEVTVKEKDHTKNRQKTDTYHLQSGSVDVFGALFKLRTIDYKVGQMEKIPIYTSEKNWELEAYPEKIETIKVPSGKFEAVKIRLKTYIGKALQQKGKFYVWIAKNHPSKPLVKVEAEVAFGSIYLHLEKFKAGS